MGNFQEHIDKTIEIIFRPITEVKDELNKEIIPLVVDTERNIIKLADNIGLNAGYTVQDVKHELLTCFDSFFDNMFIVVDKSIINILDTIQFFGIISTSTLLLLIILNYKHIMKKGINIGSYNIL